MSICKSLGVHSRIQDVIVNFAKQINLPNPDNTEFFLSGAPSSPTQLNRIDLSSASLTPANLRRFRLSNLLATFRKLIFYNNLSFKHSYIEASPNAHEFISQTIDRLFHTRPARNQYNELARSRRIHGRQNKQCVTNAVLFMSSVASSVERF